MLRRCADGAVTTMAKPLRPVGQVGVGYDAVLIAVIVLAMRDAIGHGAREREQAEAVAFLHGRGGVLYDYLDLLSWRLRW
jgi:hypothetical protein